MSFSFIGKKILVTGAGQGIGRELTKALSKAGGSVYALGRNKENIKTLADECDNVHPVIANLNDWKQTKEVVNGLETMDGVVNNAVYYCEESRFTASLNNTKEMLDEAVRVNLLAPINIIQVTANKMIDDGKHGSIVNVSSIAGLRPARERPYLLYSMTKAGLDMVTKQFAVELGNHQIRVNSVQPTWVLTEKVKSEMVASPETESILKLHTPMGRLCEVQECVDPILYLLSDHSTMVTGTDNVIDGGLMSSLPF